MLERIRKWREICPDLAIRSSFIVGFPGETDEDFDQLLEFLDEAQIDRAGCFQYEDVRGAASNALEDQVDDELKEYRWNAFMEVQAKVAAARGARMVGRTIEVLIDEAGEDGVVGRSRADAPEIDGVVRIEGARGAKPGDLVRVRVTGSDEYDLTATGSA
jgi:ribosomal protein S12 methylthiotransferase